MTLLELGLLGLAILAGAVAAVAGFGIGSLLTPALGASIGIRAAVAVVSIPHAVATATRLWTLRDAIDGRVLAGFGLASAAGGLAGAAVHAFVSSPVLSMVLGCLLVLAGLLELTGLARRLEVSGAAAIALGLASGAFGGLVGNQGGIRSAALLQAGLAPRALVATAAATAMLVDLARLPVYLVADAAEIAQNARLLVILTVGVVIGTLAGSPILRRLPERLFRRVLAIVLVVLGVALVAGWGG